MPVLVFPALVIATGFVLVLVVARDPRGLGYRFFGDTLLEDCVGRESARRFELALAWTVVAFGAFAAALA
jgi:hypothetical protein